MSTLLRPATAPTVIAVVGPTAVGKSSCAEGLARALGGEIVSADAMQVYRGMNIGTASALTISPPRAQIGRAHV